MTKFGNWFMDPICLLVAHVVVRGMVSIYR